MDVVSLSPPSPKLKVSRVSDDTASTSSIIDIEDQAAAQCSSVENTQSPSSTNTAAETTRTLSCGMEVCLEPNQPCKMAFPKNIFGQINPHYLSFTTSWFDKYNWSKLLHWDAEKESAYYMIC